MELPDIDAGSDTYIKFTDHFAGAVEGWSDAEIINDEQRQVVVDTGLIVSTAAGTLRGGIVTREAAEREATKLRARFNIRDIVLDKRVMATNDAVLNGPAMRDRTHPVFRAVFQDGTAGDVTDAKMREEPEVVARLRDRFGSIADFEGKGRIKADLDMALSKSLSTLVSLDNAETAEHQAGDEELQARLGVRVALEKAYGLLRAAFPGQRKLVESFFYRARRRTKKNGVDGSGSP